MLIRKSQTLDEILSSGKKNISSGDLFSSTVNRQVALYQCFWTKRDDGIRLPLFVVADSIEFETLFADVSTFYQNISPLSAYVNVCSEEVASQLFLESKKNPTPAKLDDKKLRLDIALILGEAVTDTFLLQKNIVAANIGYAVCTQTLAASIARATTLYPKVKRSDISERWALARRLTNQEEVGEAAKFVAYFSENFSGENSYRSSITSRFLHDEVSESELSEYFVNAFDLRVEATKIKEVYNARMSVFNSVVEKVYQSNELSEVKSACIAYFCNKILPGTMNHVTSLKAHAEKYPDVVFWYMVFGCLSSEFDYRSSMSGICLKLARDILKPFSIEERPTCDVSVDELSIISRVAMKASVLKPKAHRTVVVSLLPGVDVELSIGIPEAVKKTNSDMVEVDSIDSQKIKSLLFDALDLLSKNKYSKGKSSKYTNKNDGGN